MTSVDVIAVIVGIIGIITALIARKTWLLVEGDLAESWRWLLPSVPVYAISFMILAVHSFLERYSVTSPIVAASFNMDLAEGQTIFSMQIWKPILSVMQNIQALGELVFLILVIIGLTRQYRLFQELYDRQD